MAVRRVKKADLKRIAKATGAAYMTSLSDMDGEERFDSSMVGEAAEVVQERISDDELILIKGYYTFLVYYYCYSIPFSVPKLVQLLP